MGTTAQKLSKLADTKAAIKSAINDSSLGDVFSTYPTAITNGKSAIASAITDKGVTTAATDTFAQMATNIGQIETGLQIETVNFNFQNNAGSDMYVVFFNEELTSINTFNSGLFSVVKNSPIVLYPYSYSADITIIPGGSYTPIRLSSEVSIYSPSGDFTLTVIVGGGSG